MGNDQRRRLLGGPEIDIWERHRALRNRGFARCMRYAKRVVARRERREAREEARRAD
jgi:hypothetical protein